MRAHTESEDSFSTPVSAVFSDIWIDARDWADRPDFEVDFLERPDLLDLPDFPDFPDLPDTTLCREELFLLPSIGDLELSISQPRMNKASIHNKVPMITSRHWIVVVRV
jgi:hypothetical protein